MRRGLDRNRTVVKNTKANATIKLRRLEVRVVVIVGYA